MRIVDGRAGGGQLLRWAIAASAITGTPIRMENVRGARDSPGLRPQHVAAIELAAAVTDATTNGVEIDSQTVEFEPDEIRGGDYRIDVGTAGSISLVFDTVLPLAPVLPRVTSATVTGGTDVKWSPPIDYHRFVKLPLLTEFGLDAAIIVSRRGYYPTGGGEATLDVEPSKAIEIDLLRRGDLESVDVVSVASESLSDADVADRQAETAETQLADTVEVPIRSTVEYAPSISKGSSIVIVASFEHSKAGFTALGEPGKPSEYVASDAVESFEAFLDTDAAIDPYMADQLLPFMAIGGGVVAIEDVTEHVRTAVDLLREFGASIELEDDGTTATIDVEGTLPK
ncbi:MAG: RNA 3'-terminal phosphate cyclase [Halodesulfurarchaeum sp.]